MEKTKVIILFLFVLACDFMAQHTTTMKINSKNTMFLDELKCIVKGEDDKVMIGFTIDKEMREEKYRTVDVQKFDQVLFVNGQRTKTFEQFKSAYEKIEVGDEIKLGIKRDKERFFVSFPKGEKTTQNMAGGKGNMMIKTMTMDGSNGDQTMDLKGQKVIMNGKEVDLDSLKKSGKVMMIPSKIDTSK